MYVYVDADVYVYVYKFKNVNVQVYGYVYVYVSETDNGGSLAWHAGFQGSTMRETFWSSDDLSKEV